MSVNGDILSAVIDAAERGESLIPTRADKRPAIETWKPYQDRIASVADIKAWAQDPIVAGFAVVTGGISHLIVIDADSEEAVKFLLACKLKAHVSTPHGFHVRFRHPGWRVSTLNSKTKHELGERYPGLDIRADGGYAIEFGRSKDGHYAAMRDLAELEPLDSLPNDLRALLGLLQPPRPSVDELIGRSLEQSGGRNDRGFWLACQLRDNRYAIDETYAVGHAYVSAAGPLDAHGEREPYTITEYNASVRQAYGRTARKPWDRAPRPERQSLSQDAFETLRRELTARLQLAKADLTVTGTEMTGKTASAIVRIHLSNGAAIEVERFADVFSPAKFKPCVVGIIGRSVNLSGEDCGEIAALIVQLSEHGQDLSLRDDARDWGVAFLTRAEVLDVDMDDPVSRWHAFSDVKERDPIAIARQTGLSVASKSLVLLGRNGLRYVHSNWFAAHVRRDTTTTIANDALIARMLDVGWQRRSGRGRIKATNPRMVGELQFPFYIVAEGWEDDE